MSAKQSLSSLSTSSVENPEAGGLRSQNQGNPTIELQLLTLDRKSCEEQAGLQCRSFKAAPAEGARPRESCQKKVWKLIKKDVERL